MIELNKFANSLNKKNIPYMLRHDGDKVSAEFEREGKFFSLMFNKVVHKSCFKNDEFLINSSTILNYNDNNSLLKTYEKNGNDIIITKHFFENGQRKRLFDSVLIHNSEGKLIDRKVNFDIKM